MRCKSCDYPLWSLPTRQCPECGAPFRPSDFTFVPDSVRFCCPHCGQDYYGTGENGHLVPPAFNCVKCSQPVSMDEMVLEPTQGVTERQTKADVVPWLDTAARGFFSRLFGTIGWALVSPARLAKALPPDRDGRAWGFALLIAFLYFMVGGGVLLLPLFIAGMLSPGRGGGVAIGIVSLIVLAAVPVCSAIGIAIWSVCAHVILRVTGRTALGLGRTSACLCYASAANVLMAIPCLGGYATAISWIWWAVSGAIMITVAQRVVGWRAALATVLPPLAIVAALFTLFIIALLPAVNQGFTMAQPAMLQAQRHSALAGVGSSLTSYAWRNSGMGPPHALALIGSGYPTWREFFNDPDVASPEDRTIAGTDLSVLESLTDAERQASITDAAATLPANPVSHRVGDMVFAYHGIDLTGGKPGDGGLWLIIALPPASDPNQAAPSGAPTQQLLVYEHSGNVRHINVDQWSSALEAQNKLRADRGLPLLPDPYVADPAPTTIPDPIDESSDDASTPDPQSQVPSPQPSTGHAPTPGGSAPAR